MPDVRWAGIAAASPARCRKCTPATATEWNPVPSPRCKNAEPMQATRFSCPHQQTRPRPVGCNSSVKASFIVGRTRGPRTSRVRGLPFQIPARLADGLGLESGLNRCCQRPYAPSPRRRCDTRNLVSPGWYQGGDASLGCTAEALLPFSRRARMRGQIPFGQ